MYVFNDASSEIVFYKWYVILTNNQKIVTSRFTEQYFVIKTKYKLPIKSWQPTVKPKLVTIDIMPVWARLKAYSTNFSIFSFLYFDCNFIKKEKLYTKLKYSRSPQYDIVSGGVAALVSAFIGFLVSEKFGIELVDSGDFYVLFMYCVFLVFSLRPLIKIMNKYDKITPIFSMLPLITLINQLSTFIWNDLKRRSGGVALRIKLFFKNN